MGENIKLGEIGQTVEIFGEKYKIGDILKLINTKAKISCHFQLIFSQDMWQVFLYSPINNRPSNPNCGVTASYNFIDRAFIPLFEITSGRISHVEIERTDNNKKLIKPIKQQKFKYRG